MWNGAFSPNLVKHRDYKHNSFAEHEFANGATYQVIEPVMVDVDPITESSFVLSRKYYIVQITLHDGSSYLYLIPAEPDGTEPNEKRIFNTMNEYAANPIPGGRKMVDYIDLEETLETRENIFS